MLLEILKNIFLAFCGWGGGGVANCEFLWAALVGRLLTWEQAIRILAMYGGFSMLNTEDQDVYINYSVRRTSRRGKGWDKEKYKNKEETSR
jgi:hypothetical protein